VGGGGNTHHAPHPIIQQASGQNFKDDVDGFSSITDICYMLARLYLYTVKKEKKIFLIYKEIQSGAVAKSSMRKGFLIYKKMRKYFPIYEEAVSHI
jgi:hypothetical protein